MGGFFVRSSWSRYWRTVEYDAEFEALWNGPITGWCDQTVDAGSPLVPERRQIKALQLRGSSRVFSVTHRNACEPRH